MGFSPLQIILVFVWVFIIAIDQFDFLESLYQPIVSGAVIGAILGDLSTGLIVGGGISANSQLRAKLLEVGEAHGVIVRIPKIALCTDNGAMVAMLGVNLVEAGITPSDPDFPINSSMPLDVVSV